VSGSLLTGCALIPPNSFIDPTKVGEFPWHKGFSEAGIQRVLLAGRESPPGLPNSSDPAPDDLNPDFTDYRIVPGDVLSVTVQGLIDAGLTYSQFLEVAATGEIRLPEIGAIKVTGMTEQQVENDIRELCVAQKLLTNPVVVVTLQSKRTRIFNIVGSVSQPGQYPILEPDLRLSDAIGLARGVGPEVKRLYVVRRASQGGEAEAAPIPMQDDDLIIPPPSDAPDIQPAGFSTAAGMNRRNRPAAVRQTDPEDQPQSSQDASEEEIRSAVSPVQERPRDDTASQPAAPFEPLIFDPQTGELLPAPTQPTDDDAAKPEPTTPSVPLDELDMPIDWEDVEEIELSQRVIAIDVPKLLSGDPRLNIVIRDRDMIHVPIDTGIYYMMGEVNRPGVYGLNGRDVTLKRAIAAAGGYSALAWPMRCEIIRREPGTDKQFSIYVNSDAIWANQKDDIYLRDDDVVNVGTDFVAPFLYVIRNSFRFTYGFGFVYDRNFADRDAYLPRANPENVESLRRQSLGLPF
jgi:protein involved in polysaccharide export with SLBB domain